VKVGSGSESLGSEAGAGVIHLDEREALLGLVRDGGFDVRGMTAGKQKHGKQRERAEGKTHTGLSVTAGLSGEDSTLDRQRTKTSVQECGR
jgi:hypothetical protein